MFGALLGSGLFTRGGGVALRIEIWRSASVLLDHGLRDHVSAIS